MDLKKKNVIQIGCTAGSFILSHMITKSGIFGVAVSLLAAYGGFNLSSLVEEVIKDINKS